MIIFPYKKEQLFDDGLKNVIRLTKELVEKRNDDSFILACGMTGSGKSSLLMHFYEELVSLENMQEENIAFDSAGLAKAISKASKDEGIKVVVNDEANISKRNALSKFNKDLLDLYFACRGLNIVHLWANPSIDILDKAFITERLNGLIFVATKSINKPRIYYFFLKRDLIKIFNRYGTLRMDILKKVCKKYAYYKGWFKPYNSSMWTKYNKKKQDRMQEKVKNFLENYGEEEQQKYLSFTEVGKAAKTSGLTIRKWAEKLIEQNLLIEEIHYSKDDVGLIRLTPDGADKLRMERANAKKAGVKA